MHRIPTPIQIESSQPYRYFLDSMASDYTKKTYAHALRQFFDYIKNPDISLIIDREPKIIEAQIIDYVTQLKHQGLSYSRMFVVLSAIQYFFMINDVALNRKKISRFIGKKSVKTERGRAYTREQINQMLTVADERTGAIILFLASTGIRIGALSNMKLKHLKSVSIPDCPSFYQVFVYDGEYFTFCTPEATNAINRYMEYRTRSGEKLGPDSPLIREQFEREDTLKVRHPKTVSRSGFMSLLSDMLIKAGVRQLQHLIESQTIGRSRKEIPLNHGFRKFFNTALMNVDVHPSFKKLLMGHSVQLDEVYYDKGSDKSRAKLLEEYSKAIDSLTINEENMLRKKVEELTPKSDEMQAMRNELAAKSAEMEEWKTELRFSMDCRKRDLAEAEKLNEKVKQNTEQTKQIIEYMNLLKKTINKRED